jgi:hypothetical protein
MLRSRGPALPITARVRPHCRWVSSEDLASADLQHSRQLGQFRLMLVGVVLAEEKLSFGRQLGAYASRGTAAVAAVCPSQLGTGQSYVHGFSRFSYIHCLRRIVECRWIARRWARECTPHLAVMCTRGCAHQCRRWCLPVGPAPASPLMLILGARHSTRSNVATSVRNEDMNAGAGARADYPYRSPTTVVVKAWGDTPTSSTR